MDSFLSEHSRQPKLYIDLPSGGKFYNDTVVAQSQFVQIPIYGMTAMDEINLKTPDALFSGIATENVIKSCVPAILNPKKLVRYDIEYILLAIKIATYGDKHNLDTQCPKCTHDNGFEVNLNSILSAYENMPVDHYFEMKDLKYHLVPITYDIVTRFGLETYKIQRQMYQINSNANWSEDEKDKKLAELAQQISVLNNSITIKYINSISLNDQSENDDDTIKDFILNNESEVANRIIKEVQKFVSNWKFPDLPVSCQNPECDHEYKTTITIDYSNFFDKLSSSSRNLN